MSKQRIVSLLSLAVLTVIAAGLVWRIAFDAQSVAETGAFASKNVDHSADTLKQISESFAIAKRDNKRVLLQFGSRGCSWCHLLHNAFESDEAIAEELKNDYVVVMVDVSDGNNKAVDAKFGNPTRDGLPVTVILDSDGNELLTKNIAFADKNALVQKTCRIDTEKVLACLKKWSAQNHNRTD